MKRLKQYHKRNIRFLLRRYGYKQPDELRSVHKRALRISKSKDLKPEHLLHQMFNCHLLVSVIKEFDEAKQMGEIGKDTIKAFNFDTKKKIFELFSKSILRGGFGFYLKNGVEKFLKKK